MQVVTAARSRRTPAPRGPDDLLSSAGMLHPYPHSHRLSAGIPWGVRGSSASLLLVPLPSRSLSSCLSLSLSLSLQFRLKCLPQASPYMARSLFPIHPAYNRPVLSFSLAASVNPATLWFVIIAPPRDTPCSFRDRNSGIPGPHSAETSLTAFTAVCIVNRVIALPFPLFPSNTGSSWASWSAHTVTKSTSAINGVLRQAGTAPFSLQISRFDPNRCPSSVLSFAERFTFFYVFRDYPMQHLRQTLVL